MFSLIVENARGQSFTLTHREGEYQVISIDGLNPPKATITSNTVAGMDGARFASSKLEERNIVITIKINGDVEANRLYLYQYFRTKQYCKIYFENGARSVYAEGYVETMECGLFENGQRMQVSIICPDPYFKSINEIVHDISQIIALFEFPFAFGANGVEEETITDDAIEFSIIEKDRYVNVTNAGDDVSGFTTEITALGAVTNPVIYNVGTGESLGVNISMVAGDVLTIRTDQGKKLITLLHAGQETNCIKYLQRTSSWLKLDIGDNQFTYSATVGADLMQVLFKYNTRYEGV